MPGSHSELSASGAYRWMPCPGSVAACRDIPEVDSIYAQEGTAAHSLAQLCLTEEHDADHYVGQSLDGFVVTHEMAPQVQIYVDTCRRLIDSSAHYLVEHTFNLEALKPPLPMFGTADFISYSSKRRELHVVDLKFGRGVWVAARANPQLLYYSLGAVLTIDAPVSKIVMTVVQPRFPKADPVRTAGVDAIELSEWSIDLIKRAHATLDPEAPVVAGDWCKFCAAKSTCPAHRTAKAEAAFRAFTATDVHAAGT